MTNMEFGNGIAHIREAVDSAFVNPHPAAVKYPAEFVISMHMYACPVRELAQAVPLSPTRSLLL